MTDASSPDAADTQDRPLTQDGPALRLWMIDASAYIFRAYHALPPLTRKSDGLPIGAVAGFSNMVWKMLQETKGADAPMSMPTAAASVADLRSAAKTERASRLRRARQTTSA